MLLKVIQNIQSQIKSNQYSRTPFVDESQGIYHFDCTGFVAYVLKRCNINIQSTRASDLFDELDDLMIPIKSFRDVSCGDVIIWKKNNIPKHGDSGHVGIVKEVCGSRLTIYDCVKSIHDNDSRIDSGIGHGDIEILLDNDQAVGFKWLGSSKKTKYTLIKFFRYI